MPGQPRDSMSETPGQKPFSPDRQPERRNLFLFVGMLVLISVIGTVILAMHDRAAEREGAAVKSLQELNSALRRYHDYMQGFPVSLKYLGPSQHGEASPGWIDTELASGKKGGYCFQYRTLTPPEDFRGVAIYANRYTIHADPCLSNGWFLRHFFSDASGIIRVNRSGMASAESPKLFGGFGLGDKVEVNAQEKTLSFFAYAGLGLLGFACFLLPVGLMMYFSAPYLKKTWHVMRLRSRNPETRRRAVQKLIAKRAIWTLEMALLHKDALVRETAAEALGQIGDARVVGALVAAQDFDQDWHVVKAASEALVKIGDAAVEPLVTALKDQRDHVRSASAQALGNIGSTRAVEPLVVALIDQQDVVRSAAAGALGKIGDRRAVEPLVAALKDDGYYVWT